MSEVTPSDPVALEMVLVARLKAATLALRDSGVSHQRAQNDYKEALQAFNRFVAPEQT